MRILALGDNVVDVYRNQGVTYPGGNALNVAVNAARLGYDAAYLGAFASDAYASFLQGFLEREGVDVTACPVVSGTTTKRCVEDVVEGERHFVCVEDNGWVGPLVLDKAACAQLDMADVVCTSVNAKMDGQLQVLAGLSALVAYDLGEKEKYRTPEQLAAVAQVADIVQLSAGDGDQEALEKVVQTLAQQVLVVVTRGSDPTLLAWPDGRMEVAVRPVRPRDTMGAGDAHLTALACGLAEKGWRRGQGVEPETLRSVAEHAGTWAAQACLTDGGFQTPYEGPLAVVYDMDGVLAASEQAWEGIFRALLAARGLGLPDDARRDLYGCSDEHENEVLGALMGLAPQEVAPIKAAYVQAHPIDYASIGIPGVHRATRRLRELGLRLAIATSSPAADAQRMLAERELEGVFDVMVTAQDVEKTKPDPALYLCAARQLGVDPSRCVAVDDSPYGVEAAHRAGMYAVHFAQSDATPAVDALARCVCRTHDEVLDVIEQLVRNGSR